MGWGRTAALAVAGGVAILGAEAYAARRRTYLGADTAPSIGGTYGRAFAPPLRLAVLGDSTAAGVGVSTVEESVAGRLAQALADTGRFVTLDGLGVSGSRCADLGPQVSRALVHKPDVAVVLIGANDATHLTPYDELQRDVAAAVGRLRRAGVNVVVGACPDLGAATVFLPPLRQVVAWVGRGVATATAVAARAAGAAVVDLGAETGPAFRASPGTYFAADRFHPSPDGYALWAAALAGEVRSAAGVAFRSSI